MYIYDCVFKLEILVAVLKLTNARLYYILIILFICVLILFFSFLNCGFVCINTLQVCVYDKCGGEIWRFRYNCGNKGVK